MFRDNITLMPLKRIGKTAVALELTECGYASRLSYYEKLEKKEILLDGKPIDIVAECWAFSFHYKVEVSDNAFKQAVDYLAKPIEIDPASCPHDLDHPFFEDLQIDYAIPGSDHAVAVTSRSENIIFVEGLPVAEVPEEEENLDPDYWLSPEHKEEFKAKPSDFKLRVWDVSDARDEAKKKEDSAKQALLDRAMAILDDEDTDDEDEEEEGNGRKVAVYDPLYNRHFLPN